MADGNADDEDVTFEDPDWVDKILARAMESAGLADDEEPPGSRPAEATPVASPPADEDVTGEFHRPAEPSELDRGAADAEAVDAKGEFDRGPTDAEPSDAEVADTTGEFDRGPTDAEPSDAEVADATGEFDRGPTEAAPTEATGEFDRGPTSAEPTSADAADVDRPPPDRRDQPVADDVDPLLARRREPPAAAGVDPLLARAAADDVPTDADDLPWSSEPADGAGVDRPTEAHDGWFADDWDDDGDTVLPENLGRGPSADEVIASWVNEEGDHGDVLVATSDEPAPPRTPKSTARTVAEWGAVIVGALLVAFLVKSFLVQAFYIPSASMVPTLNEGDRVLVNKLSYDLHDVNRGDVIVFNRPPSETGSIPDLIKRAIAFGGETITFRDGDVFIDGQLLIEPYLAEEASTEAFRTIPGCENEASDSCAIPEDHIFVMGDNRSDSRDSRFFGPIDEDLVVGRAFVKIWPLTDIGGL